MNARLSFISLLIAVPFVLGGCTTTYTRDGKEIPADFAEASLAENSYVDAETKRIESVVDSIEYERGSALLRNLQWLIAQKELAIPSITDHLADGGIRTKANLLYVLGFTRTEESTAALASHMHHKDSIVRYEAAAGLLNQGDMTAVPVLIGFLDDADRRFRFKAIQILKGQTGHDFNYRFGADKESRQPSINRWKAWWSKEKERLMYRPKTTNS